MVHFCLLSALDSPISKKMDIYVYTLENEIIWFNSETRLPRNFNRFKGLMESLLEKQEIRSGEKTLIKVLNTELGDLLSSIQGSKILMREEGKYSERYLREKVKEGANITLCIGGFPHGDYRESTLNVLRNHDFIEVSLGRASFTGNYILNRAICILEGL